MLPNRDKCLKMLKDAGCSEEVIEHCKTVTKLALKIAGKCNANLELVEAGALLHDIGRSRTHGVMHGVEGAEIGRKFGLPDEIICIIERHLGGGISKEEAVKIGLPEKDYTPITLEEKIVCHADNLIAHDRKQTLSETIEPYVKNGRSNIAEKIKKLHRELSKKCGIDLDNINV
ncbi:MAG: HDIG domain-containing protein [Candidatus Thermoplasmatota archaeon]|nr:HDIG domain-containing protein [Candidatus Thermoplasmatota archaeon]